MGIPGQTVGGQRQNVPELALDRHSEVDTGALDTGAQGTGRERELSSVFSACFRLDLGAPTDIFKFSAAFSEQSMILGVP